MGVALLLWMHKSHSFSYTLNKIIMARGGSNAVPKFVEENYRVGDEIAK